MKDLISRQAAIDALDAMKICRPLDSDRYVISDCMNKIAALPSAQTERKKEDEEKMTVYKPMTPSIRRAVEEATDKKMSELSECEDNAFVQILKLAYEAQRTLLTSLPDGYLLPCIERRK